MTEAANGNGNGKPQWFDKRITLSGLIQIVLLMFALFKFSADIDKRTSLMEQTLKLHDDMLRAHLTAIEALQRSTDKIATVIEQYQRGAK